jgi:hypothetical protein
MSFPIHLLTWALSNLLNVPCKMSDSCREIHLLTWALGNLLNVPCKMSDSCRERHLLTWALGNCKLPRAHVIKCISLQLSDILQGTLSKLPRAHVNKCLSLQLSDILQGTLSKLPRAHQNVSHFKTWSIDIYNKTLECHDIAKILLKLA